MFAESKCENLFEPVVAMKDIAGTKQNALNLIKKQKWRDKKKVLTALKMNMTKFEVFQWTT